MVGRKPIVISHKARISLAVKIQLFPFLGSMESSQGEEGLAHKGDRQLQQLPQFADKTVTLVTSALLLSRSGEILRMWVMFRRSIF